MRPHLLHGKEPKWPLATGQPSEEVGQFHCDRKLHWFMTGAFLRLSLKAGEAELSFLRTGVSPSKGELSQATEARVPSWIAINAEEINS